MSRATEGFSARTAIALESLVFICDFSLPRLCSLENMGFRHLEIQLIQGHESRKSLEVYQHLTLESVDRGFFQKTDI